jgi:tetratricopeptide (TPR) repeat protein
MIRVRLSQLTPAAFAVVAAASVLDHSFPFERLYQVADLAVNDALPALDEVLKSHVLREASQEERLLSHSSRETYCFTHDKIRDVVYTEAGETRRRIYHQRAFEVLHTGAAPPAELAHHALAAGLAESTFHWSLVAGDEAMHIFAMRDAVAHYEQARQIAASRRSQHNAQQFPVTAMQHLYLQLGQAYEHSNEFKQAHSVYQTMLAFAQESGIHTTECIALNRLAALVAYNQLDVKQAAAFLHQALSLAEQSGESALLAETECNLAQLYMYQFDAPSILQHAEHGLMLAQKLGQEELIARSLNLMAYARLERGYWEEAEADAEQARIRYRALGNRTMETGCLSQITTASINCGRPQAAIRAAQQARDISQAIEYPWGQASSAKGLAEGFLEIGAYTEALAYAEQGVDIARKSGILILLTASLIVLGAVHRAMLNLAAARAVHLEALEMMKPMGAPPVIEMMAVELCADCALAGASGEERWEEALAYAEQALSIRSGTFIFSTKLLFWCQTEALLRAGEIERATEEVQHYGELIANSKRYRIPYLRALAVLAQYRNEIDAALARLQEAEKLAEGIGLPGELWSIQAALGDLYLMHGETEQAHSVFKQAATIIQQLANNIGNDEQKANFLTSPLILHVLEQA